MRILALDTSGEKLIACRYEPPKEKSLSLKASSRQDLLLDSVLDRLLPPSVHGRRGGVESALDCIAVGTGPGRFTGVRIGLAFAVVLGKTLKVPVAGFRGLESLAYQYSLEKKGLGKVLCVLHSVRDEWFYGLFLIDGPGDVAACGEEKWGPRAEVERIAKHEDAVLYEGPLKASTLARRAEALLAEGQELPPAEPYYLKPGNYVKTAGGGR